MLSRDFINRILRDPAQTSLPPIVGIENAPDMSAHDALVFAWRSCTTLQSAMPASAIDVRPRPKPGPFLLTPLQGMLTSARVHFVRAPGPDPHCLTEHQALSIHMCPARIMLSYHHHRVPPFTRAVRLTQDTPFSSVLDDILSHPDRSTLHPYKP